MKFSILKANYKIGPFFNNSYINRIISLFTSSPDQKHIWNVRIGKNRYYIQEVLNNYALLGTTKMEIQDFFQGYPAYSKTYTEWIYEVKKSPKGICVLLIYFDQEKPVKVAYSYLQYKLSER